MHRPSVAASWRAARHVGLSFALLAGTISGLAPERLSTGDEPIGSLEASAVDSLPLADGAPTRAHDLISNGSFDRGLEGWKANQLQPTTLTVADGFSGRGARLATDRTAIGVLNDIGSTLESSPSGVQYRVSAWVRTDRPNVGGHLRVREIDRGAVSTHKAWFWLEDDEWHEVELMFTTELAGAALAVNVLGYELEPGRALYIDELSMIKVPAADSLDVPYAGVAGVLSNGCEFDRRGIPECGAYFGAAHGGNADPSEWEADLGQRLGVHRTYWRPDQVIAAVRTAGEDLSNQRLPWISFKMPYSWSAMADGRGDAWAEDLADRLAALDGPVWLAFHHEPEGDGSIPEWKRMQEHLAPLVRATADNVAYTVILTGWNQLYGPAEFGFANLWPDTTVDVAGFDIFQSYGQVRNGRMNVEIVDLRERYFEPIAAWAEEAGVAWGLAETGYSDEAAEIWPEWPRQTYADVVDLSGVAFSYFDTDLNSNASWDLADTPAKMAAFADAISGTPTLPDRW